MPSAREHWKAYAQLNARSRLQQELTFQSKRLRRSHISYLSPLTTKQFKLGYNKKSGKYSRSYLSLGVVARVQLFCAIVAHNVLGVIVELQRAMTGPDSMISQRMYTG